MRRHDNWDRSRGSHGGVDCWDKMGDDYIDAKSDQFFSELLGAIAPALRYSGTRSRCSGLPNSQACAILVEKHRQTDVGVKRRRALQYAAVFAVAARARRAAKRSFRREG